MKKEILKISSILSMIGLLFFAAVPITNATVETGWPAGQANICKNPTDGFIDFEEGTDEAVILSTIPGVKFTTTYGIDWRYGDIRTGKYNVYPYGHQGYETNGNFFAWLGVTGDTGRIDFTEGTATYLSVLVSTYSGLTLDAYDASGNLIATSGWASNNIHTRTFTRLTVEAPGMAYVIVHDWGNYWLIDDLCTDAPGVPSPVNQPPVANANGPYVGNEGSQIIFDGSGSSDPDGTIVLYEWDLDGDGQYDDAIGVNPSYTWNDDYTATIGLKVTDDGGLTDTASTTVTVNNVAPTVDAGSDMANYSGQVHNLSAFFTDPGLLDTHTATIDWGDGSLPEAGVVGVGTVTGSHVYFVPGSYTITITVTDDNGGVGSDSLVKTVAPLPVQIDIKPGSFPNSINLGSKGNVPVGVFTATYQAISFDATTIDRISLVFAGAPDLGIGKSPQDLDADGDMDMVFHFDTQKLNLTAASTQATMTGKTTGGIYFEGSDNVRIVPPK